jgi:hypothetical protein
VLFVVALFILRLLHSWCFRPFVHWGGVLVFYLVCYGVVLMVQVF